MTAPGLTYKEFVALGACLCPWLSDNEPDDWPLPERAEREAA